jgi:formate hydrogenlyase subunit 3/multisubunit Na+/H+ antiporter MnhD subunit
MLREGPAQPPLFLAMATAVSLVGLVLGGVAVPARRRLLGVLAVAGGLACGALLVEEPVARTVLLEAAAVAALGAVWWTSDAPAARRGYLAAVVLSGIGMVAGAHLAEQGRLQPALALLLPGVAIKLALVPAWFWLPLAAESTPAVVAGLVIAIVDVAAFGEVLTLAAAHPWLLTPPTPWLALGLTSTAAGALMAMAQRHLKRLLAFSTLADMGLLTMALGLGGTYGPAGAAVGAAVHALAKALLFVSLAAPESEGDSLVDARGLASRHPIAAAGFLVGALSVLGVPPTLGYAAHWRIFAAAARSAPVLAIAAAAAMLSVAVYARAIALFWWGSGGEAVPRPPGYRRPWLAAAVILLSLALVAFGFWPHLPGGGL